MMFLLPYPLFQSIYAFIKSMKHCSLVLRYKKETDYVTFWIYEGQSVYASFVIDALKIDDKTCDFTSQLPTDIIFSKINDSILELSFFDSKIRVIVRYENTGRTKIIQEFSLTSSLFNPDSIKIPKMENLICTLRMNIGEYKDLVEFVSEAPILLEVDNDISFDIIGKDRKLIRTCTKLEDVKVKEIFSCKAFYKIKGLGSLVYNKERVFNKIRLEVYEDNNKHYIILQSDIYPKIFLIINPANHNSD